MEQGRSESYRQPTRLEQVAAGVGSLLPAPLRSSLRRVYAGLLQRVQPSRFLAELPGGETVRLLPAYRQIRWNALEYEAFRADVGRGDTVLDVGANIGAYSVLFAKWVGDRGRVFAFEPAPESYRALCQLLEVNGVISRVTALGQAVSSAEGTALFAATGDNGANRLSAAATPDAIVVPTTTIDAVCRRFQLRPSLIKIDVEGAELDVLRGARETIAANDALRIYMEVHPQLWPEFGASRDALETELASQGLRLERLDGIADVWDMEGVCLRVTRCGS